MEIQNIEKVGDDFDPAFTAQRKAITSKINEMVDRVNMLTDYMRFEMSNGISEENYNKLQEIRKALGVKI